MDIVRVDKVRIKGDKVEDVVEFIYWSVKVQKDMGNGKVEYRLLKVVLKFNKFIEYQRDWKED